MWILKVYKEDKQGSDIVKQYYYETLEKALDKIKYSQDARKYYIYYVEPEA